jgi:hypothetical protein
MTVQAGRPESHFKIPRRFEKPSVHTVKPGRGASVSAWWICFSSLACRLRLGNECPDRMAAEGITVVGIEVDDQGGHAKLLRGCRHDRP